MKEFAVSAGDDFIWSQAKASQRFVESSRLTNLEFSLLSNLGLYLMVLNQADTAAAAAAGFASH